MTHFFDPPSVREREKMFINSGQQLMGKPPLAEQNNNKPFKHIGERA